MDLIVTEGQYIEVITRINGLELSALQWLLDKPGDLKLMASIFELACKVFGFPEPALMWLSSPQPALNGLKPSQLMVTASGAQQCLSELNRIDHGIPL